MRVLILSVPLLALALSACSSGNVRRLESYNVPPAPHVKHPHFNPYAPYGSVPAIWQPQIANREGTIVNPHDPNDNATRPDYEHAHWSIENSYKKAGTF